MAEAAAKEPSMEDILSSIRKIIADEGDAVDTAEASSDRGAIAEAIEPSVEIEEPEAKATFDHSPAPEVPSAVSSVPEPVKSESIPHVPVEREPEAITEAEGSGMSLAKIAASLQATSTEASNEPASDDSKDDLDSEFETESSIEIEEVSHVEMAEATPPPQKDFSSEPLSEAPAIAASTASNDEIKREEDAFRGALMSPGADNAVSGSFDRLKRSAMDDVEAKTEAILRPMLREWLDENLPSLVEKLVREEIERVARG